ncbi:phage tail terminator-like protein [Roseomonas sp. BN140053]|uniref:phage tail terminator-like protein n=1 Tax=Roseomonas sp. BN140053 TaxID=3391898 RepID=UPI0039E984B9
MSSPEVWADARVLITAGAAALSLPVAWPNETFSPPEPLGPFLAVEVSGDGAEPLELGGGVWVEDGAIHLHVMVPTGWGITQGLQLRKALADGFRGLPPRAVVYDRFTLDPGGMDEDGNWFRLSLRVAYRYQDIGIPA